MKVFFEFSGGPRDGELLEGCPEDANIAQFDIDLATAYFWETRHGKVGEEFFALAPYHSEMSPGAISDRKILGEHKYRVVNRIDESDGMWVVARYIGPVHHSDVPDDHKCPWYEHLVNLGVEEVTAVHLNFPQFP